MKSSDAFFLTCCIFIAPELTTDQRRGLAILSVAIQACLIFFGAH